ncbi:hypothetical protein [Aulosira sp. FACHB-615]|uniref:hypothetical protein n=1 Tax=Aulosira sp. FACHB-615 TaxID=2692777 RepID=UPI001686EBAA|nr:hypothetical protein [Aulosira sp. FACHB-615]MBD2486070.1 hypothetical protein [Aulosira sp. FACHB-615]
MKIPFWTSWLLALNDTNIPREYSYTSTSEATRNYNFTSFLYESSAKSAEIRTLAKSYFMDEKESMRKKGVEGDGMLYLFACSTQGIWVKFSLLLPITESCSPLLPALFAPPLPVNNRKLIDLLAEPTGMLPKGGY